MKNRKSEGGKKESREYRGRLIDHEFSKGDAKLTIREHPDGSMETTLEGKDGKTFDLASLLPEGWKILGNKLTNESYLGLANTDSSLCFEEEM